MRCILQESQQLVLIAGIGHIHLSLLHVYLQVLQRCPENTRLRPSVVDMRPPSYAASDLLQVLVHSRSRCSSLSVFVRPFLRPSLPSPTRQASFNGTLFRTLTASEPWFTSCMKSLIASTQADLSALTGCDAYDAAPPDRCDGTLPHYRLLSPSRLLRSVCMPSRILYSICHWLQRTAGELLWCSLVLPSGFQGMRPYVSDRKQLLPTLRISPHRACTYLIPFERSSVRDLRSRDLSALLLLFSPRPCNALERTKLLGFGSCTRCIANRMGPVNGDISVRLDVAGV